MTAVPSHHPKTNEASVRVALCQIRTAVWDYKANLQATIIALETAADNGAEIAVTPECVLTGYGIETNQERQKEYLDKYAELINGPSVQQIAEIARRRKMHIVLGIAERAADETGKFYNAAVLIDRDGEIAAVYRKVHCRMFESSEGSGVFTPGDRFVVTSLACKNGDVRLGLNICFDFVMPESMRCVRAMGAELVVCPLACNTTRFESSQERANNEMIARCRAAENEVYLVVVNHSERFNGGSFVVGPAGECVAQLGVDANVAIVDIPVGKVRTIHQNKPFSWIGWSYRRPNVYHATLGL